MERSDNELGGWVKEHLLPHAAKLKSWLRSRFSEERDIDDIVQESYAKIIRAKRKGAVRAPKALLYTTARNLALDAVRRRKIVRFEPLAEIDHPVVSNERALLEEAAKRENDLTMLTEAIQSLPDRCRRIFTLRRIYSLSQAEIAQELGISINTVSAQLTIGIHKCTAYIEARRGEDEQ